MKSITVEVVYATPDNQQLLTLVCEPGITAIEAVRRSAITDYFPNLNIETAQLGIFARKVNHDQPLAHGDRVEIYRPLQLDPKQARQLRAKRRKER